jgi:hypothetical protein
MLTHTDYAVPPGGDYRALGMELEMMLEALSTIENTAGDSPVARDCKQFREDVLAKLRSQGWDVRAVKPVSRSGFTEYALEGPAAPKVDPKRMKPEGV